MTQLKIASALEAFKSITGCECNRVSAEHQKTTEDGKLLFAPLDGIDEQLHQLVRAYDEENGLTEKIRVQLQAGMGITDPSGAAGLLNGSNAANPDRNAPAPRASGQ